MRDALNIASARLAEPQVREAVLKQLLEMVNTMKAGSEAMHLASLVRSADYKGSDVKLLTGEILDGAKHGCPYPASAWKWETVQSYKWETSNHINVLEFVAFLNYVRLRSKGVNMHSKRFLHIFDSRVVACVVAKGRSSSKQLNRVSRRLCAYLIATHTTCLSLWTVSKWNYADAGSRLYDDDG